LNAAAEVMFLVSGAGKAEMLKDVLEGPEIYPCQRVKPVNGNLLWMVDQPAGRLLTR
jgi:6-phosphogluconolactonase